MAIEMAFPLLVTLFFFLGAFVLVSNHLRSMKAQRNLPLREEWLAERGEEGAACPKCGSASIREQGLDSNADDSRVVSCGECREFLYRLQR